MNFNDLLAYAQSLNVKYSKLIDMRQTSKGEKCYFLFSSSVNICYVVEIPEKVRRAESAPSEWRK